MQRFEKSDGVRVTHDEAKQVFDLWASRQQQRDQFEAQPTISDIAEGLHISEAQVQELLIEVRAREIERERREKQRPKMIAAAAALGCLLLLSAVWFASRVSSPLFGSAGGDAVVVSTGTAGTPAPLPEPTRVEIARDAAAPPAESTAAASR